MRDRAVLSSLRFTASRARAVAKLRLLNFQHDAEQFLLRFQEKDGRSRQIPVRLELQREILAYLSAAGIGGDAKDRPLLRSVVRKTKQLTGNALTQGDLRAGETVGESRRATHAALAAFLRVSAITDLLTQGVPLEDVQHLARHAEPRTTGLYERRQKRVMRNILERISM
jgi:integrase/recombinase XerD